MKILAKCDKCNSSFSVEEQFIGRKAKCSKCGEAFVVQAARGATEPQKPAEADPAPTEYPADAAESQDVFSVTGTNSPRCPICQNDLAPDAVLCVNCGYDLRAGARVQYKKYKEQPKAKSKKKSRGIFTAQRLGLAGVLFGILVGSIAGVWGAIALYRYVVGDWEQHEAFLRLDAVFSKDGINATKLAEDLPHIFAYIQQLPSRLPKYAQIRNSLFLEAIPKIPKVADPTPLLLFPPDSPAYQPILEWFKENSELSWQMEKSCDPSDLTRHYGADLLMASLPFISWSEADKNSLRERTEVVEKERRFRKYADQSQLAAEKKLPGRFYFRLEATYANLSGPKEKMLPVPDAKIRIAQTPGAVFEATSKDKTWNVSFFGRDWTGPIEQLTKIDLMCPVKEHENLFKGLPFYDQLPQAEMHLRFNNNAFVVELDKQANPEYFTDYQIKMMNLTGFNGFKTTLIKATP